MNKKIQLWVDSIETNKAFVNKAEILELKIISKKPLFSLPKDRIGKVQYFSNPASYSSNRTKPYFVKVFAESTFKGEGVNQ